MNLPRISPRPLLLGHRGARALKSLPENTLASFDQALADGCDGFEFDVRLSADGKVVVCHDPQTGGVEIAGASGETLSALPRLEDVLVRYQERAFLDIELKVSGPEKITVALLQKHPPRRGFVVSSFLPEVLQSVHDVDASVPLGLICETRVELYSWTQHPIEYVIPHYTLVDELLIDRLRNAGKKMFVWTVNAAAEMHRFGESGVNGIISDNTALLCRTLAG